MKQINKIYVLIVVIAIFLIGAALFFSINNFSNKHDKKNNSNKVSASSEIIEGTQVMYLVENCLNEMVFIPQIYSYDIENNIHKKLFELDSTNSGLFDIHASPKGILFIPYTTKSNNEVVYFDYEGNLIKAVLNEGSANYNVQVNIDGEIFAFQSITIPEYIDDLGPGESVYQVRVINMLQDQEIIYKATDFLFKGEKMQYISPIGFDKDNYLYVITSPNFGGDIGDQMIIYKVDIMTGNQETILFSGVEVQYDSDLSQEEYLESAKNAYIFDSIYPEHSNILLKKGVESPHEIVSYNYSDETYTTLFDPATIDNEADLSSGVKSYSPSGDSLVIRRCGYIEESKLCEGFYKGFHILNIKTNELTRDFLKKGEFVAWLNDKEVLYLDYRGEAWDDVYHTLKKIDIDTGETIDIYTQTTDRPYSPDTAKQGDERFIYIGILN